MSRISSTVGGSKTTLWTYFRSKQDLFAAVVDDLIERYGRALDIELNPEDDLAICLRRFARALLDTLHAQPMIDLHRLTIGEAGRFPELACLFYERGAARGKARLRAYFEQSLELGKLRSGDMALATEQFAAMLQVGSVQRHLLGFAGRPGDEAIKDEIEAALDTFLRAWGA